MYLITGNRTLGLNWHRKRPLLDSLVEILTAAIQFDKVEESLCFDPHHVIVWSKGNTGSFKDSCFYCLRYLASPNLAQIQGRKFGRQKWEFLYPV
jgi:hypothetical protein